MRISFILFFLLYSVQSLAESEVSIFHRLLIVDERDMLMMVKIKGTDFWVTPGWYQDDKTGIKDGASQQAAAYGLTLSSPELRGIFALQNDQNAIFSLRHMLVSRVNTHHQSMPDDIEEVRWLPLQRAKVLMTFPHINLMIEQVMSQPDTLWSGTVKRYKHHDQFKAEITQPFYSL